MKRSSHPQRQPSRDVPVIRVSKCRCGNLAGWRNPNGKAVCRDHMEPGAKLILPTNHHQQH